MFSVIECFGFVVHPVSSVDFTLEAMHSIMSGDEGRNGPLCQLCLGLDA